MPSFTASLLRGVYCLPVIPEAGVQTVTFNVLARAVIEATIAEPTGITEHNGCADPVLIESADPRGRRAHARHPDFVETSLAAAVGIHHHELFYTRPCR